MSLVAILFSLIILPLIIAIKYLANADFNNFLRVPLIVFFVILIILILFLGPIIGYEDGIEVKARLLVFHCIMGFDITGNNKGSLPLFSQEIEEEEKVRIKGVIESLPKKGNKIEYYGKCGNLWEYYLKFDNGDTYSCAIEAPATFLRSLFTKKGCRLYRFEKMKK